MAERLSLQRLLVLVQGLGASRMQRLWEACSRRSRQARRLGLHRLQRLGFSSPFYKVSEPHYLRGALEAGWPGAGACFIVAVVLQKAVWGLEGFACCVALNDKVL